MTVLVIGFGNRSRRDDGAGLAVVDRLRAVEGVEAGTNILGMLESWSGYNRVVMVDAMRSGMAPGTTVWVHDLAGPPADVGYRSTHDIGPIEVLGLAAALGRMPDHVDLIGIEAEDVRMGTGLTTCVEQAVESVVEAIDHA